MNILSKIKQATDFVRDQALQPGVQIVTDNLQKFCGKDGCVRQGIEKVGEIAQQAVNGAMATGEEVVSRGGCCVRQVADKAGEIVHQTADGVEVVGSELISRSGLARGVESHYLRNSDSRLIEVPPAGTPLLVSLAGLVEHTGVFLGDSRVAELNGNGRLMDVSLSEFINGQSGDTMNLRLGTRIFAACDAATARPLSSPGIAQTARDFINQVGSVDYNVLTNNCHLFTASCICGRMNEGRSVLDWLKDGTFSIARLESVIQDRLNGGNPMAWIGVRGPGEGFSYVLTDAKIQRLRREGRLSLT